MSKIIEPYLTKFILFRFVKNVLFHLFIKKRMYPVKFDLLCRPQTNSFLGFLSAKTGNDINEASSRTFVYSGGC